MEADFREATERAKDSAHNYWERSRDLGQQAFERGKEYYGTASNWVSENQAASIGIVSSAVGFAVLGYLVGRSGRKESTVSENIEHISEASSIFERNFSPIFKLAKLYFLYRAAA